MQSIKNKSLILGNTKLVVNKGISENQIKELISFSNKDLLILSTTQDSQRFKDKKSFETWLQKKRTIYVLTEKQGKLLGVIWFGLKTLPKNYNYITSLDVNHYGITFAIRLYQNAREKGLSGPFINETFKKYKLTKEFRENPAKGMWLETKIDNLPAIKAYKKFGFDLVSVPNENGKIIMCRS